MTLIDQPGSQNDFVSVGDTNRESFHKHPWSIGGGAAELKELIESVSTITLENIVGSIGIGVVTLEDDAFSGPERIELL